MTRTKFRAGAPATAARRIANKANLIFRDEAPRCNPLDGPELSALHPDQEFRVGGQGIRFLRRFADWLEYEATPAGNRLRMGFTGVKASAVAE